MVKPPRALIWLTCAILVSASIGGFFFYESKLPAAIVINTKGQPTIGYPKAKVHVVVFKEPKCSNCKEFSQKIFPKLKKNYIDTNKITYTVIPVSFLPGSMPVANALLCAYYADPLYPNSDLCFTYMEYIYEHQPNEHIDWATPERLVQMAQKASAQTEGDKLKKCIEKATYRIKIEQNTNYGRQIMGGRIVTPTVYVNGIEVKEITFDNISKLIKEVLEHGGS